MNTEWQVVKGITGKFRAEHHIDGAVHPSPWFDTEKEANAYVKGHDKRGTQALAEADTFAKNNGFQPSDKAGHWFDPKTQSHVGVARMLELAGHQK